MKIEHSILRKLVTPLCAVLILLFAMQVHAQDSTAAPLKNVTIKQDPKISELMKSYAEFNRNREFTKGYRIQIMYTDVRDEVYQNKGKMYVEFPQLASYVEYEEPYYKLRLGDFKTRLEATYYLQKIIPVYSGAFIVKDKIKVK